MSAPIIWIIAPGIISIIILFLLRWSRMSAISGVLTSLLLTIFAWRLPIGIVIPIGSRSFTILESLTILGRRLVIENGDRPTLTLIYLLATVWFFGALVVKPVRIFIPLSLSMVSLMVAFLVVEPFLYAALIIELATFICIPLLSPPGNKTDRGTLRFLTFITLGTPFILLAGWALNNLEVDPANPAWSSQALIYMAIGFCFLLAVFPFNTWIPVLAEEAHPYTAGLVFSFVPAIISIFGIGFIERYPWLYQSSLLFELLRIIGVIMVISGGLWAAFQNHLGRLMGYALVIDSGLVFFLVGCSQMTFLQGERLAQNPVFSGLILSRGLIMFVWATSLSLLKHKTRSLMFTAVRGSGRQFPIIGTGIILAIFSLAGYPLLAGYPVRQMVWNLVAEIAPQYTIFVFLGFVGLLVGSLRALFALFSVTQDTKIRINETKTERVFISLFIVLLFILGLFPM